jgi:hypothetical protein
LALIQAATRGDATVTTTFTIKPNHAAISIFIAHGTAESHPLSSVLKPSHPPLSTQARHSQSTMSERKVLTKYYPPDFDPSQLGRSRGPKKGVLPTIRLETPFSMRCTRCGSFIPKVRPTLRPVL